METDAPNSRRRTWLCAFLAVSTLALYLPSARFDFLTYDDQQYVTENPHVRAGFTRQSLTWAFGFHVGNWHPLTWLSHMLDCQLYGLHPAGHHLTNVLLHTANTILLFLVLSRMTGALWPAVVVAALFGWHPLHVESVAWVAERKDVLCAFFFTLTLGAYAKYATAKLEARNLKSEANSKSELQKPSAYYALALFLFAFGLLSKPMVVTLPFVLLLLDYWPLQRFKSPVPESLRRLVVEKLPFLVLATVACVLTCLAQSRADAVVSTAGLPISTRLAHAIVSYAHYIRAIFWPRHLAVYYPYETAISPIHLLGAGLLLAAVSIVALFYARKLPFLLVGWLWFLGMLVPVIGLVQVGEQAWADRYTYLPSIGIFVAVVWIVATKVQSADSRLQRSSNLPVPKVRSGGGAFILSPIKIVTCFVGIALIAATSIQLRYWQNTRTLFAHAVAVTRRNYLAVTLLGSLDAKAGKLPEAIEEYKTALSWKPDYPEAHFFLGNALDQEGKFDAAIIEYQKALWFRPIQEQTHIFLGAALAKIKNDEEAIEHYRAALKLNPESAVAHNNLAKLFQAKGDLEQAMEHYSAALKFDPTLAQAHNNLGVLLIGRQRPEAGIRELHEALRLDPGDIETEFNLALALNQGRQWSEAAELLAKVLEKKGNDSKAHYELAVALTHLQKTREAMNHYASALLLNPDFPDALDGLSWILATAENPALRNGTEATRMAEKACELTGRKDAQTLKTLAAAYAEVGRFNDAVSILQSLTSVQPGVAGTESSNAPQMLAAFKSGKPWRDPQIK